MLFDRLCLTPSSGLTKSFWLYNCVPKYTYSMIYKLWSTIVFKHAIVLIVLQTFRGHVSQPGGCVPLGVHEHIAGRYLEIDHLFPRSITCGTAVPKTTTATCQLNCLIKAKPQGSECFSCSVFCFLNPVFNI